jgi:hypothetical protein
MPNRINASQIKSELDHIIAHADTTEPLLAERLRQFSRWIKNTKPGSLTKKKLVVDFLFELILDAALWLDLKDLNREEKIEYYREAELTPSERYWYEILFPAWFSRRDPKLTIWTQKMMAEEFQSSDSADILLFTAAFKSLWAPVVYRHILDLSMATDLLIDGRLEKPLAIQLTRSNPKMLSEKQDRWRETLIYWNIERGVLFSHSPSHSIEGSAISLLSLSDSLVDGCYAVEESVDS